MSELSACLRCGHTNNQHGGGIGCDATTNCRCSGFKGMVIDPDYESGDSCVASNGNRWH